MKANTYNVVIYNESESVDMNVWYADPEPSDGTNSTGGDSGGDSGPYDPSDDN